MFARLRLPLLLVVVALLLVGCKAEASVSVAVRPNGSGEVQVAVGLDAEASAKAGDLSQVLRLADLKRAGWRVDGPAPRGEVLKRVPELGGQGRPMASAATLVVLTHPFANVAQANAVLADLSGPKGVLRDVRLSRSSSFGATKVGLHGTLDFSRGLDSLADPALTRALGGRSLGQVATELNGGQVLAPSDVEVAFAAHGQGFSLSKRGAGGDASVRPGDAPVPFAFGGTERNTTALLLAAAAVVLLLGAVALLVLPRLPGRTPPPPAPRKRQLRSADDGWDLVASRNPTADATKDPPKGRRKGRHSRPRGQPPSWDA